MKKLTAYINPLRSHRLVEELRTLGVAEIVVTDYYKPLSQASRLELCCEEKDIRRISEVIHRIAKVGGQPDHALYVEKFDPALPSQIPLGHRVSRLEESRIRQLIATAFKGVTAKLSLGFLVITISIFMVAFFVHARLSSLERTIEETRQNMHLINTSTREMASAVSAEQLAVDLLHHDETAVAMTNLREAGSRFYHAVSQLRGVSVFSASILDSLEGAEVGFQAGARHMTAIMGGKTTTLIQKDSVHLQAMVALNARQLSMMRGIASLEAEANSASIEMDNKNHQLLGEVRASLTLLAIAAVVVTILAWAVMGWKVSKPIRLVVEEAQAVDGKLAPKGFAS